MVRQGAGGWCVVAVLAAVLVQLVREGETAPSGAHLRQRRGAPHGDGAPRVEEFVLPGEDISYVMEKQNAQENARLMKTIIRLCRSKKYKQHCTEKALTDMFLSITPEMVERYNNRKDRKEDRERETDRPDDGAGRLSRRKRAAVMSFNHILFYFTHVAKKGVRKEEEQTDDGIIRPITLKKIVPSYE